jgi:four helix bundle protein
MVTDGGSLIDRFGSMADFKKLLVWQKAHALALNTHRIAARIRGAQNASLRSQMTRAAQSIAANIVEGRGQKSEKDFARFLGYSLNSASELEYHFITARDVKAISMSVFEALAAQLAEVRKMLHGLIARLGRAPHAS